MLQVSLTQIPDATWDKIERLPLLGPRERHKVAEAARLGFAWNFAHESAGGDPWPPLAPMTVNIRRDLGFAGAHPILQRTRELKRSLVEATHPLHYYLEIEQHGDLTMQLGSLDDRFPLLHAGGFIEGPPSAQIPMPGFPTPGPGRHYVPPRPMTVLGEQAISRLHDTLLYVVRERVKRL